MSMSSKWSLTRDEQEKFISALTNELAPLRAKVGISQGELAYLIGVSRQTYCAIESGKRSMSWSTFLSLILFFDYNQSTHQMIRTISAFPDELVERFNNGKPFISSDFFLSDKQQTQNIVQMVQSLDEHGLHALKTVLLMEYGRCTNSMDKVMLNVSKDNK